MNGEPAIEVSGLEKRFGDNVVVTDFDMTVPKGAVYGFLGPNGSGKTTTIRMMCGLMKPDAGGGRALNFDILTQSREIKARVGYMTQHFSLYGDLTVRENLSFLARLHALGDRRGVVDAALEEYALEPRAGQLAAHLSGGWKQRLALAAASLHKPDLLLLDEPTAGVDPKARRDFWDRIRRRASEGVTVLVSTHYMDEAVQCDFIAFIAFGRKLIDAPTTEIPDMVGLATWRITADDIEIVRDALESEPGVEQIARFGDRLHVSGRDRERLARTIAAYRGRPDVFAEEIETGLEETFIYLMSGEKNGLLS